MILGRLHDLALWPHPWPWPWSSRSESEIALSQELDCRLTWNEKDVSHPFMTMISTSVTMVGWADVPDSDWGDFKRWRAIDISTWFIQWFVAWTVPSHYLNQWWYIVNWTLWNKLQWNHDRNLNTFFPENTLGNVVCEIACFTGDWSHSISITSTEERWGHSNIYVNHETYIVIK